MVLYSEKKENLKFETGRRTEKEKGIKHQNF